MSIAVQEALGCVVSQASVVNDFSIRVAVVNGSGSQTSNGVLLRALFKMGIPVTGKNLFPSNIQGLPSWYVMRLSKDGYLARRDSYEIAVCMNGRTIADDVAGLAPGGVVLYDDSLSIGERRPELTYYPMPVGQLVKDAQLPSHLKDYLANMVYVGLLAYLLGIDLGEIQAAVEWNFGGKPKPIALNMDMVHRAYTWASQYLVKTDRFLVSRMTGFNENKLLVDGNTAAALGTIFGGVTFVGWYPITPATSLIETLVDYLPKIRNEKATNKATCGVVQAEDELAALGMVIGAGWAGARAMTGTSGPGLSLMAELAGLAYFAEVPVVIWDVQRVGPSTGLPTRTGQGDILEAYYLSHGDTRHVVLFPASPSECFDFGVVALDLAERLQTVVEVLSDLDLGMNVWITDSFEYPEKPIDRGKVLSSEDLQRLGKSWGRYKDIDGDGIPYRTVPGGDNPMGAYFARGTGHNEYAIYSERPEDWENNLDRLALKLETASNLVPGPVVRATPQARIGILSIGSNDPAVIEAQDMLTASDGPISYMRLRALPINQEVRDFIAAHERTYVVENNHDGQLHKILLSELPSYATRMVSICRCNGLPLTAEWICRAIRQS